MPEWDKNWYIETAEALQELRDNEDIDLDHRADNMLRRAVSIIEEATPRMAADYVIRHAIHIGDREVVFGENKTPTEESPAFLVSYAKSYNGLNFTSYEDGMAGNDYLEMMRLFLERVEGQVQSIEKEQAELAIPNECFEQAHIVADSHTGEYAGKLMVINADVLRPEYRNMAHQLVLAERGNGCTASGHGSAVYSTTIATGKHQRFERVDFLGELRPEYVPDWARAGLEKIKQAAAQKQQKKQEAR